VFIFVRIEHYYLGWERSLNYTSTIDAVDVGFIFPPSTTTLATQLTHNNGIPCTRCPSPLMRDVGPITNATSERRNMASTHTHPPLLRDVGGSLSLNGGVWGGRERHARGDPVSGRPSQCITKHKPQCLSWLIFATTHSIPQPTPIPNTTIAGHRRQRHKSPIGPRPIDANSP